MLAHLRTYPTWFYQSGNETTRKSNSTSAEWSGHGRTSRTGSGAYGLISSNSRITTLTTTLLAPVGTIGARLRDIWQTLEWDGHLMFDHATFWRTMAGNTLLGNGSKWVWLEVMWCRWTWLMELVQNMVVSCACSVASSNMGSMRMHTPTITAQLGVKWLMPSRQWR